MAQPAEAVSCSNPGDTAWVLAATTLVLGMVPGLCLFEIGLVHEKHKVSLSVQIMSGSLLLCILWVLFGFSLTFGESQGGFIGNPATYPLFQNLQSVCLPLAPKIPAMVFAMFHMMFAAIAPLLQTGSFVGRFKFKAFLAYIVLWELFVYYPLAHWIWGNGFLSQNSTVIANILPHGQGVIDFAGGIVIHASSGVASFVCAIVIGKRSDYKNEIFRDGFTMMTLIGTGFLWTGWFGFNAGSALMADSEAYITIVNTQLAACICGIIWFLLEYYHSGKFRLIELFNGTIAGLAGITPASGYVSVGWAFFASVIIGVCSFYGAILLNKYQIDDTLDVSIVHGLTGIIGSFANGFFASEVGQRGWVKGNPIQIANQLLGIVLAVAWSAFWTFVLLKVLDRVIGIRIPPEHEELSHVVEHGENDANYDEGSGRLKSGDVELEDWSQSRKASGETSQQGELGESCYLLQDRGIKL